MKQKSNSSNNSSRGFQGGSKTQCMFRPEISNPFAQTIKTDRINQLLSALEDEDIGLAPIDKRPFNQRVFNKTMTIEYEKEPIQQNIPGILQQKELKYLAVPRQRQPREAIIIIQCLVRQFLARRRVEKKRIYFKKLVAENQKFTIVNTMVRKENLEAQQIIKQVRTLRENPPKTGDPYFTAIIEMHGYETKEQVLPKEVEKKQRKSLRLKAKSIDEAKVKVKIEQLKVSSDGCTIWKAFYKKKYGKEQGDLREQHIKISEDYLNKQLKEQELQVKVEENTKNKLNEILEIKKPKVETKKKKVDYQDIDEDIDIEQTEQFDVEEDIADEIEDDIDEIVEDNIGEDSQIQSQIKDESIYSQIKESVQKSSKIQESIQEEYPDDFEEGSQIKSIKSQSQSYYDNDFESYHSQEAKSVKSIKSLRSQKSQISKHKLKIAEFVPQVVSKPIEIEDGWSTKRARQEAEILLKNYQEKYQQLRTIEVTDQDFEDLKQEHKDLKLIQQQVKNLVQHTGDFYKDWNAQSQPTQKADELYAKFQYEFSRLLSMNSLGARFSRIINTTLTKDVPSANVQNIVIGIEKQFQIIQQVLEQVQYQISNLFGNQVILQELKNYRQEMDQKMQWILFKQDKLINQQLQTELAKRDKDLRQFIIEQFEKQRRNFGTPQKVQATLYPNSLKDDFAKSSAYLQSYKFDQSAQSKKDSSIIKKSVREESDYQPDFEEESERIKTEKSERDKQIYESMDRESMGSSYYDQNDFEQQSSFFEQKDKDTKQIVDYLAELLMKEIQQEMFPSRQFDSEMFNSEESPKSEEKQEQEEHLQPLFKPKQQTKEVLEVDDFGMGGPVISREELSKEFDLSGPVDMNKKNESDVESDEESKKPILLVVDPVYQQFVYQILEKYGKLLIRKELQIQTQFELLIKQYKNKRRQETLGSLLQKEFKFIRQDEIYENNAFQIVQSLEEQLCEQMLAQYNHKNKQEFYQLIELAKKEVLKITDGRIPLDAIKSEKIVQNPVQLVQRIRPIKDCQISEELQDYYINEELETLAQMAPSYIMKQALMETMQEFEGITKKRGQKK